MPHRAPRTKVVNTSSRDTFEHNYTHAKPIPREALMNPKSIGVVSSYIVLKKEIRRAQNQAEAM